MDQDLMHLLHSFCLRWTIVKTAAFVFVGTKSGPWRRRADWNTSQHRIGVKLLKGHFNWHAIDWVSS
jgi:hypothetical protein